MDTIATGPALSLKTTPAEIKNRLFKRSAFGFSPGEVSEYLDAVSRVWDRMQRQEKEFTEKVHSLNEELVRWRAREAEVAKLKEAAEADARAVRAAAEVQAEKAFVEVEERANRIRERTEEWLEGVIAQVEQTERQRLNFMTAFKSALDSHYELLKTEEHEIEPLGAQLNEFLKSCESDASRAN